MRCCHAVLVSLGLASVSAHAVDAVSVSLGKLVSPNGEHSVSDARVAVDWRLPWQWWESEHGVLQSRFELGVGYSRSQLHPVWSATAIPLLHYQFHAGKSGWGPFVQAGVGLAGLSETRWAPDHDLNTHWQFASRFGLGYAFGQQALSLEGVHFSNAGLSKPNPGGNVVMLRYRYAF
jgi:lipid A 3-O-deacylase